MHTPQELAAMNDCTDILRYLDGIASKQVTESVLMYTVQGGQADFDLNFLFHPVKYQV